MGVAYSANHSNQDGDVDEEIAKNIKIIFRTLNDVGNIRKVHPCR